MTSQAVRRLFVALLLLFTFVVSAPPVVEAGQKTVHVKGYTKKDGTEVKPHDRKAPKSESTSDEKKSKTKAPKEPKTSKATTASKTPKVSAAANTGARPDRCESCDRDEHGKIVRSGKAKDAFKRATGYPHGRPGYVIDHIQPLACGGADAPSNMQWQTKAEAETKDRIERAGCR